VSYERRRYRQLYSVLESHTFSPNNHASLQHLWFEGHYAEESAVRRRPLSAVDKYRIRRRHPLPTTIWDGEQTVYCFKVYNATLSLFVSLNRLSSVYYYAILGVSGLKRRSKQGELNFQMRI